MSHSEHDDWYARATQAADQLRHAFGVAEVQAAVVLGSGWGPASAAFGEPRVTQPMADVAHFHTPVAPGHPGTISLYDIAGHPTIVFAGRTHLYEGLGPGPVVHAIRTAAALGARAAILTNANGSLQPEWALGDVALISDHLNLAGGSPLVGARFADLTDLYSTRLRAHARSLDPALREGVYAMFHGPHYETQAEARAAARMGADLVGMSTAFEAIAGRERGLEVVAFSTVTANEFAPEAIDPDEVVAIAERSAARLGPLLAAVVGFAVAHPAPPTTEGVS